MSYMLPAYFVITLLHSLWQAAILYIILFAPTWFDNKATKYYRHPNNTLIFLAIQILISLQTFYFVASGHTTHYATGLGIIFQLTWFYDHLIITNILLSLYILLMLYQSFKTFISWMSFRKKLSKNLTKAHVHLRHFVQLHAKRMGIRRKVNVFFSEQFNSPFTIGFFKPLIVLPVSLFNHLHPAEAEMMLMHELKHIVSNDWLKNIFLTLCEHVFFFNPFILSIVRNARLGMEIHCDETVINHGYDAQSYARALLLLAKSEINNPAMSMGAVSHAKNTLLQRVGIFIDPMLLQQVNNKKTANAIFLQFLSIILWIGIGFTILFSNSNRSILSKKPVADAMAVQTSRPMSIAMQTKQVTTDQEELSIKIPTPQAIEKHTANHSTSIPHESISVVYNIPQQDLDNHINLNNNEYPAIIASEKKNNQIITSEEIPEEHLRIFKAYELVEKDGKMSYRLIWTITENTVEKDSLQQQIADSNNIQ